MMQSKRHPNAAAYKPQPSSIAIRDMGREGAPLNATTLPPGLLKDGWWLVAAPPQPPSRPKLRLVPSCGALQK